MNISQEEYSTKLQEYFNLVKIRKKRELQEKFFNYNNNDEINYFEKYELKTIESYVHNKTETNQYFHKYHRNRRSIQNDNYNNNNPNIVYIRFSINKLNKNSIKYNIDEANLRLLLVAMKHLKSIKNEMNDKRNVLTLKVYQLIERYERIWLDTKEIDLINMNNEEKSYRKWLEFDVTNAVKSWLNNKENNLGLEIHCDKCSDYDAYIIEDNSINPTDFNLNPILNIITNHNYNDNDNDNDGQQHREKRSQKHHHFIQNSKRKVRKTDCYKENQKCCRHTMEVIFKEIKGFEFIIQPKVFDAGYCRGKCPPRYNPAHHHAFLQSLIWKQDRTKVPRPCCAPSKLVELEVLHVDENDNKKLKVSTWADMRVLECACS